MDDALIGVLNSKLRGEYMNTRWHHSLENFSEKPEACRKHYNEQRPYSAAGSIPPILLTNSAVETIPLNLKKNRRIQTGVGKGCVELHEQPASNFKGGNWALSQLGPSSASRPWIKYTAASLEFKVC